MAHLKSFLCDCCTHKNDCCTFSQYTFSQWIPIIIFLFPLITGYSTSTELQSMQYDTTSSNTQKQNADPYRILIEEKKLVAPLREDQARLATSLSQGIRANSKERSNYRSVGRAFMDLILKKFWHIEKQSLQHWAGIHGFDTHAISSIRYKMIQWILKGPASKHRNQETL